MAKCLDLTLLKHDDEPGFIARLLKVPRGGGDPLLPAPDPSRVPSGTEPPVCRCRFDAGAKPARWAQVGHVHYLSADGAFVGATHTLSRHIIAERFSAPMPTRG